jgi:hypothetical protein
LGLSLFWRTFFLLALLLVELVELESTYMGSRI